MNRKSISCKYILPILMALILAGCDPQQYGAKDPHNHADEKNHFEPHYDKSLFETTDNKLFSVEMLIKHGKLVVGDNAVDIIIHGQGNKDVEGAVVTVEPWMTEHGRGLLKKPVTIERGAGLYTVAGITLMMEGAWELRIHINANGVEDSTSFLFADVKLSDELSVGGHSIGSTGRASQGNKPAALDFSSTSMSYSGSFKLSYTSNPTKIPLNKIHSWELYLQTVAGKPVSGAKIRIRGDMPAHGHGLPTQPLVTGETSPGKYRVKGMKFNMPGHWTVTFDLDTVAGQDSATFNLKLR